MISGRRITLSLTSFEPATFAAWTSRGRRPLYVVVNGGVCLVRAGDGTRMGDWRPEHRCPSLDVQGKASGGRSPLPATPIPGSGASGPPPSAPAASSTATHATVPLSDLGVPTIDTLAALIIRELGAVLVERERNGRVVYRRPGLA